MPLIPHLMVLDDDPRVLESLVPAWVQELGRTLVERPAVARALGWDPAALPGPRCVRVRAHGYKSERLDAWRDPAEPAFVLHLVCERGGRFDVARRLLNEQLFGVVLSDLRFSEDAGGLRAGQFFVEDLQRVHPELQGLLYSAYPRPEAFPADRFVRKEGGPRSDAALAGVVADALERHLAAPAVAAFARAVANEGLVYQSESFGRTLGQLFATARLFGSPAASASPTRARRPLPCLLIDGESGTGKRGLAAVFHAATERRQGPLVTASCNELTNETLLRSILFGHRRGAFTDAREDRAGLVAATGKGVLVLDDLHRLPTACSAILHSFLEDGEYSRLGEEESRRQADAALVLTVESAPWALRRRSGELPLAFLARVERLPLEVAPLRERPEDIAVQARWWARAAGREVGASLGIETEAIEQLRGLAFDESNSRELRNLIERAAIRYYRETDVLGWRHLEPPDEPRARSGCGAVALDPGPAPGALTPPAGPPAVPAVLNEWQQRVRQLAARILARARGLSPEDAQSAVSRLFDEVFPPLWEAEEAGRAAAGGVALPVWEDLTRCYAVYRLGGPRPAEGPLGIPANTLRQWIHDREAR
jgi:DNA-binding NtrC family response regulator